MQNEKAAPAMVMSVLEGRVAEEHGPRLKRAYDEGARQLPAQMVHTFLVQHVENPTHWQVISIWQSREALAEYSRSVEVPEGILFFRSVDAEPTLSLYDVAVSNTNVERSRPS